MIELKSPSEIKIMAEGGEKLSEIARAIKGFIREGISTKEIDSFARAEFKKKKMKPSFLGYGNPPFPASICTSVNDEIVHGIPSDKRILRNGDILSVDLGGEWKGFNTDMAFTVGVGKISEEALRLIKVTEQALENGISKMYTSNKLYDISWAIQQEADEAGYGVVRELVGHGIGRDLHESPQVPNYGKKNTGIRLEDGLVLAIEPMFNVGTHRIHTSSEDNWTVKTEDGSLSCHFEHTVAVSSSGPVRITFK